MTPAGLALFYAGMTRSKNVLNTFSMVMGAFVLAFVVWIVADILLHSVRTAAQCCKMLLVSSAIFC